jgi:hypothetical protein
MGDSMVAFGNLSILARKLSQMGWHIFIELPKNGRFYENAFRGT